MSENKAGVDEELEVSLREGEVVVGGGATTRSTHACLLGPFVSLY